ncbi:MAG: hypothetical protein NVS1B10_06030 [Candidatus Saccharimonadales bacterium]
MKETTKNELVAWSLGSVGAVFGIVEVGVIQPAEDILHYAQNKFANFRQAKEVNMVPSKIVEMPTVRSLGKAAISSEQIAA